MDYFNKYLKYKYLKYKNKYLNLKDQLGGYDNCNKCTLENLDDHCYNVKRNPPVLKKHYEFEWTKCREVFKPKVYLPLFHSCQSGIEKIIPPDCILINTSVCGLNAFYYSELADKITELFESKDERLRDPINNRKFISEEIGYPITIHTSGDKYLDFKLDYHLLAKSSKEYKFKQYCSGLFSLDNGLCNVNISPKHSNVQKSQIKQLYRNSIFPTESDIANIFHKNTTDEMTISNFNKLLKQDDFNLKILKPREVFKLSNLIEKFPGIYYFTNCRGPCKGMDETKIPVQRQRSIDTLPEEYKKKKLEKNIQIYIIRYGHYLFQNFKKNIIELKTLLKQYISTYSKDETIVCLKKIKETINTNITELNIEELDSEILEIEQILTNFSDYHFESKYDTFKPTGKKNKQKLINKKTKLEIKQKEKKHKIKIYKKLLKIIDKKIL